MFSVELFFTLPTAELNENGGDQVIEGPSGMPTFRIPGEKS